MKHGLFLLLLLPASANADNPFECVDPDFVHGFLDDFNQQPSEFSRSIPEDFRAVRIPDDFNLVGSRIRGTTATLVYTTDLPPGDAIGSATEELSGAGWTDTETLSKAYSGGFRAKAARQMVMICHDDEPGLLSVTANNRGGQTYLSLTKHDDPQFRNCATYRESRLHQISQDLNWNRPTLELPKDVKIFNSDTGASSDKLYMQISIESDLDGRYLLSHFGDQIRDQNWMLDADWSGSSTSGSLWLKETSGGDLLTGALYVIEISPATHKIQFDIYRVGPAN